MHIIDFLSNLKRRDGKAGEVSNETKYSIYRPLRSIFNCAVEWKLIKENPVASVKRPERSYGKKNKKQNVYDEDEVATLFEKSQNELHIGV